MNQSDVSRVQLAVSRVPDPELGGVTIGDLGLVRSVVLSSEGGADNVTVELTPTFLGCPALDMIASDVLAAVRNCVLDADDLELSVRWVADPPWSPVDISPRGKSQLRDLGISVADPGESPACPYCLAAQLEEQAPVGPTACRSLHWCHRCRNVVEVMRSSRQQDTSDQLIPVRIRPTNREPSSSTSSDLSSRKLLHVHI